MIIVIQLSSLFIHCGMSYHIRGLFGGDFNLVVWRIFIGLLNLNYAILTPTHEMN